MYSLMLLVTSDPVTQHSRAPGASLSACPANLPLSLTLSDLSFLLPQFPGPGRSPGTARKAQHTTKAHPVGPLRGPPRHKYLYIYGVAPPCGPNGPPQRAKRSWRTSNLVPASLVLIITAASIGPSCARGHTTKLSLHSPGPLTIL